MLDFSKIDIKRRLVIGFLIVPTIMVILNIVGISEVNSIDRELYQINEVTSVKQRYAINFRGSVHDRAISIRDVILNTDPLEIEKSISDIRTLEQDYKNAAINLDEIFEKNIVYEKERSLLENIKKIEQKALPIINKTLEYKKNSQLALAQDSLMNNARPVFIAWLASINAFIDYQESVNSIDAISARNTASGFQNLMIILTAISLLVAIISGLIVTKSIVDPLNHVAHDIDKSSNKVASVADHIRSSSNSVANGSSKQAASIEEISSAIEQMNHIVKQNAEFSERTSSLAQNSRESAQEGERVVMDMVNAIEAINESNYKIMGQVDDSNRQMSEIAKVIEQIGEKTTIINDIVFQTKLLSFNASVEAARAGIHGKGFSVVAEEIGKLAQMSGVAAKEISDMLTNSSSKVESIVSETQSRVGELIESGKEKVEAGSIIARQCSDVLQEIVVKVNSVTDMGVEMRNFLKEQSEGFSLITKNISEMDKVTQENSVLATQNVSTIQSLNEQTIEMRKAYSNLSALVGNEIKISA